MGNSSTFCDKSPCCNKDLSITGDLRAPVPENYGTPCFRCPDAFVLNADVEPISGRKVRIAVVRHGERQDAADPRAWFSSKAAKTYPFDPPLTKKGQAQAEKVAEELYKDGFSMVVSSPYARCIGTAVKICQKLGKPLCIDAELGEVFGPCCFGDWSEPGPLRRKIDGVLPFIPEDVKLVNMDFVGEPPEWPETLEDGRIRMASRVEEYASRAVRLGGVSIVLVTHGDCVASCAALAKSAAKVDAGYFRVTGVEYCAYVKMEREYEEQEEPVGMMDPDAKWIVNHKGVTLAGLGLVLPQELMDDDEKLIQAEGKKLEEKKATRKKRRQDEQPRIGHRTTTILLSPLHQRKSMKLLSLQDQAGSNFEELLPNFPADQQLSDENKWKLEEFTSG